MDWSPNDTKRKLMQVCRDRGIKVTGSLMRSDMIELLQMSDADREQASQESQAEKVAESLFERDSPQAPPQAPPQAGEPPPSPAPALEVPLPSPSSPAAAEEPAASGVLDYLLAAGDRVSFHTLIKDCGPGAKEEVKKLVSAAKVIQYRQHNKFWFKAR